MTLAHVIYLHGSLQSQMEPYHPSITTEGCLAYVILHSNASSLWLCPYCIAEANRVEHGSRILCAHVPCSGTAWRIVTFQFSGFYSTSTFQRSFLTSSVIHIPAKIDDKPGREVRSKIAGILVSPEGPSTQYLKTLVSKTSKGMVYGTRSLKRWVLGPSGYLPERPIHG